MTEEREPAERKRLHLPGDQVEKARERKYFGPTYRTDGGAGRVWRFASAIFDPGADLTGHPGRGSTVVWLAPVGDHEAMAVLEEIHKRMGNRG